MQRFVLVPWSSRIMYASLVAAMAEMDLEFR
jgi:hypothetical protein